MDSDSFLQMIPDPKLAQSFQAPKMNPHQVVSKIIFQNIWDNPFHWLSYFADIQNHRCLCRASWVFGPPGSESKWGETDLVFLAPPAWASNVHRSWWSQIWHQRILAPSKRSSSRRCSRTPEEVFRLHSLHSLHSKHSKHGAQLYLRHLEAG